MIASNVTINALNFACDKIGVRAEIKSLSQSGLRHRVKLYPLVPKEALTPSGRRKKGERGDCKYQRISASHFQDDHRVHAVCWHGFRDFFRAVYSVEPEAIFRTSFTTWRGANDFEIRHESSATRNIGSIAFPISAADACKCDR